MQPESYPDTSEVYRNMTGMEAIDVGSYDFLSNYDDFPPAKESYCSSSFYPLEMSRTTTSSTSTDTPQARALAALKNHKEAEKRRRERINSHLDKLRTLLPCNSKTDKATLLAKVVQRVNELKQQTSDLTDLETFPTETDDITVVCSGEISDSNADGGGLIFKASMCCDDRSDLMPDLTEVLKSLRLKPIRAEMSTVGGRIRNVLIVAAEKEHSVESVHFLRNALKGLLERSSSGTERCKRRRILERRSIGPE